MNISKTICATLMSSAVMMTPALALALDIEASSPRDKELALESVDKVLAHFNDEMGYSVTRDDLNFTIKFMDRVMTEHFDVNGDKVGEREVSGYYNGADGEIVVRSFDAPRLDRTPMGVDWDESVAQSILEHEITHAVVHVILGDDYVNLDRLWHEVIAYGVQFEVMDPELYARVQAGPEWTDATYENSWSANFITYSANPDQFSIIIHNTVRAETWLNLATVITTPPPSIDADMFMRF